MDSLQCTEIECMHDEYLRSYTIKISPHIKYLPSPLQLPCNAQPQHRSRNAV